MSTIFQVSIKNKCHSERNSYVPFPAGHDQALSQIMVAHGLMVFLEKAFKKMSYADCFAAALAGIHQGELITGDPGFEAVEKQKPKRLLFTRGRGGAEMFFIFYYKLFYSAISASPRAKKYSARKWQNFTA